MRINRSIAALWVLATIAVVWAMPAGALAETVINFDDLNLPDYGDIPGDYQSRAAGTPNIVVSYRTFEETDNSTIANHLDFWNSAYGDLSKVAFAVQNGRGSEITLAPDPGFSVNLLSFDLAGYSRDDRTAQFVRIVDASNNLLVNLGSNIVIQGSGPSHSSFNPNFTHAGTIKIQWANDWNIGIDNVRFDQVAAIPEPSTLATSVIGGMLLTVAVPLVRRRRGR